MKTPIRHIVLERDHGFREVYQTWFDGPRSVQRCAWLMQQFQLSRRLPGEVHSSLVFLNQAGSAGLNWETQDLEEARYLLEFFRDKILSIGYRMPLADVQVFANSGAEEQVERYYLKPAFQLLEGDKRSQAFGNITLSVTMLGKGPASFRCLCHYYQDSQYAQVQPFSRLIELILEP